VHHHNLSVSNAAIIYRSLIVKDIIVNADAVSTAKLVGLPKNRHIHIDALPFSEKHRRRKINCKPSAGGDLMYMII